MQNSDGESMKNKMPQEYKTKDLGESAALICKSARLLRLERQFDFFWFVFSDKKFCQKITDDYWYGELLVNAKSYQNALRTLKDRLFAQNQ